MDSNVHAFWKYLTFEVPKCLIPKEQWSIGNVLNKDQANSLIDYLQVWLLGGNSALVLNEFKKINNPPALCGHSFSSGEATYTCIQCAIDGTCVMCQSCFRRSEHKNHKYKMHSSGGGGCCDCGDLEAWKSGASCSLHSSAAHSVKDVRSLVSEDLRTKLQQNFRIIFKYICTSLTITKNENIILPEILTPPRNESRYSAIVIYNDELHTYDYVIRTLTAACNLDAKKASDFATIIDREGRSIVKLGNNAICMRIKQQITHGSRSTADLRHLRALLTFIFPIEVIAHQEFAIILLSWITDLAQKYEAIRLIVSDILLEPISENLEVYTVIGSLMNLDSEMWKSSRSSYFKLIMSTVVLNIEMKKQLSIQYTRLYPKLITDFVFDDQELSASIMSLSVQIFTVPSLAFYLCENEKFLEQSLQIIMEFCCKKVEPYESFGGISDDDRINLVLNKKKIKQNLSRFGFVFHDIRYILTTVPTFWSEKLKTSFLAFINLFIKIIDTFEGMDSVVREVERHLEMEPEWQTAVSLHIRYIPVLKHIFQWCKTDSEILQTSLKMTIKRLALHYDEADSRLTTLKYSDYICQSLKYDITVDKVSVHYPLTRFLAALLATCHHYDHLDHQYLLSLFKSPDQLLAMADRSIRCLALSAQTLANAWRRNGLALVNQTYYTRELRCRDESFDRDVQMLQICCSLLDDQDRFFVTLLDRFNIYIPGDYFTSEILTVLEEEFISLLIYICFERYDYNIGCVDFKQIATREIIHTLACGPRPHSKISNILPNVVVENPEWENILKEVADYCPAVHIHNVAKYRLKSDFLLEVNPHFYHYSSPGHQSNAIDQNLKQRKLAKQSTVFVPRAAPPFKKMWERVLNLLLCRTLMSYLRNILKCALLDENDDNEGRFPSNTSDRLIEKTLYLIASAVVEEREKVKMSTSHPFIFCQRAEEEKLMDAVRAGLDNVKFANHKDMVCWIINASDDIQQRRLGVVHDDTSTTTVCSPSTSDTTSSTNRKKAAVEHRKALMNQMMMMQKKFKEKNSFDLASIELESSPSLSAINTNASTKLSNQNVSCFDQKLQIKAAGSLEAKDMCILCQDNKQVAMVLAAYVQVSNVLCKDRSRTEKFKIKPLVDMTNPNGVHISTCSHVMHLNCWKSYYDHQKEHYRTRNQRRLYTRFDITKREFECPLCRRLCNCILPVISQYAVAKSRGVVGKEPTEDCEMETEVSNINSVDYLLDVEKSFAMYRAPSYVEDHEYMNSEMVIDEWYDANEASTSLLGDEHDHDYAATSSIDFKDSMRAAFEEMDACFNVACCGFNHESNSFMESGSSRKDQNLLLWRSISYTIQSLETVARFKDKPVMSDASIRDSKTLSGIIRSGFLKSRVNETRFDERVNLMGLILGGDLGFGSILTSDIFSSLVNLLFAAEGVRINSIKNPTGKLNSSIENDSNLIEICTIAQITQIILHINIDDVTTSDAICDSKLIRAFHQIRSYAKLPTTSNVDDKKLEDVLTASTTPFIQCCMLLMRYVTDVEPNSELKQTNDFSMMLQYLSLPSDLCDIICDPSGGPNLHPIIQKWCSNPDLLASVQNPNKTYPFLSTINSLVKLDKDYCDLMARATNFRCPRFPVEDEAVHPTLCMICGKLKCSQTYCCQEDVDGKTVGPSTYHSYCCSHGHGVFLRVLECKVLLLNRKRGCFRPAPYVDRHGETDSGFKRGNPLFLDQGRMKELNLLWLNHQVDDTTVHDMDNNRHFMVTEWLSV